MVPECGILRLCIRPVAQLLRRLGPTRLPLFLIHLSVLFAALLVDHYDDEHEQTKCYSNLAAACALLARALQCFSACSERKVEFRGIDVTGAEYARDLPLTDHNGQQQLEGDFAARLVVVLFGFTMPRHSVPPP